MDESSIGSSVGNRKRGGRGDGLTKEDLKKLETKLREKLIDEVKEMFDGMYDIKFFKNLVDVKDELVKHTVEKTPGLEKLP